MCEAGFTVVRTYTAPPDDVVELAGDWGLRILAGVFYPDWRYSVGRFDPAGSRRRAAARMVVRAEPAGSPAPSKSSASCSATRSPPTSSAGSAPRGSRATSEGSRRPSAPRTTPSW